MEQILNLLAYPFVQRAIISGLCAGLLLATLGIFVTLKKMSFFSDGVAHGSLVGVAVGVILNQQPLLYALIFSVVFSVLIFFLEQKTNINTDSLLAILFTSSLALGVLLMSLQSGYRTDLMSYLFGNILTIRTFEVWLIFITSLLIAAFVYFKYRTYLLLSLNSEMAALSGIPTKRYQLLFYVLLAVSTVLSIKVLGVVLVSALLIIPVSTAKLLVSSSRQLLFTSILFSELSIVIGIFLSLQFNLPVGSVIVLVATLVFIIAMFIKSKNRL